MIDPVVSVDWLQANRDVVVICEVGSSMGGSDPWLAHLDGHLPGARFVHLDEVLSDPPAPGLGRHPLPDPERFAADLGRLGIGDDVPVIAYDDAGGGLAARLVWMLRVIGQDAALLDGGVRAWTGVTERGAVEVDPVERRVRPWPEEALADADAVAEHASSGGVVVDSRSPERYRGETEPIDAVAGHIPGAVNLPFVENLDGTGRLRPVDELRDRFTSAGVDAAAIVSCGSGVTACQNILAAEMAGLDRPRLYVGSWSGWTTEGDRPVATGDD